MLKLLTFRILRTCTHCVLKCLNQLLQNFSAIAKPHFADNFEVVDGLPTQGIEIACFHLGFGLLVWIHKGSLAHALILNDIHFTSLRKYIARTFVQKRILLEEAITCV